MSEIVQREVEDNWAILTLHRPEKRNSLNRELIGQLHAAVLWAQAEPTVRVLALTGSAPAFCAGMDLGELQESMQLPAEQLHEDARNLGALYDAIYHCPKATIALVNGHALAGGAGIVSVCDFALSVPTAKFGYPEVKLGLVAALVLPHLLRHVGERAARSLLLTGQPVDAQEALQMGLITRIVPADCLRTEGKKLAGLLAEAGPLATANTKRLLRELTRTPLSTEALAGESARPRLGAECQSGVAAFFAKQRAPWVPGEK